MQPIRVAAIILILICTQQTAFAGPAQDKVALGDRLMKQGDAAMALHFYDKAVDLSPGYWPAYLHRGDALAKLGQHRYAADDYRKVLQLYPGCPAALQRLGRHHSHSAKRT